VFIETFKTVDGLLQNIEYHQYRVNRTLKAFNIKDRVELKSINFPKKGTFRCRVIYRDKILKVEFFAIKKREFKKLSFAYSDSIEYGYKYENRDSLNNLKDKFLKESDEILIIKNGLLTDTTISNIALFDGVEWVTPKTPLLKGTVRDRLLKEGKLRELDIPENSIFNYKKIALLNAILDFYLIESDIKDVIF